MGYSRISVTIPDEIYSDLNTVLTKNKMKISHLVTEALVDKLRKIKEEAFVHKVNEVFRDPEVKYEQRVMVGLIADNTDVEELPW